jgi:hypothetical protein
VSLGCDLQFGVRTEEAISVSGDVIEDGDSTLLRHISKYLTDCKASPLRK